jgi:hypothetical protein
VLAFFRNGLSTGLSEAQEGEKSMAKKTLPTHRIYVVKNFEGKDGEEKSSWVEVGVCFENKVGFSIQLHALPMDGRLVALPYEEKAKKDGERPQPEA